MSRHRASPYRLVDTNEWHAWLDASLSLAAFGVLSYLRTSFRSTRLPGLIAAGAGIISWDLQADQTDVESALGELTGAGIVFIDSGGRVLYMPGVLSRNLPGNQREAMGMARDLADLSDCPAVGRWLHELFDPAADEERRPLIAALTGELTDKGLEDFPGVKDRFQNHWPGCPAEGCDIGSANGCAEGCDNGRAKTHSHSHSLPPSHPPSSDGPGRRKQNSVSPFAL